MSSAGRLFNGGISAIFAAVAVGLGIASGASIIEGFKQAANEYAGTGEVVLLALGGVVAAGLALMAVAGAVASGKDALHPR